VVILVGNAEDFWQKRARRECAGIIRGDENSIDPEERASIERFVTAVESVLRCVIIRWSVNRW
jgi:hypothetical protein